MLTESPGPRAERCFEELRRRHPDPALRRAPRAGVSSAPLAHRCAVANRR